MSICSVRIGQPLSTSDLLHALLDSEPGEGFASYFDAETGHVIEAPTRVQLLDALISQRVELLTRAALVEKIENGELDGTHNGRPMAREHSRVEREEWDHLRVDLSDQPDPERARAIIIKQLRRPAMAWRKNQGGGRFQDVVFAGARTVVADPVYTDDEGRFFEAFIHTYALKAGLVSPRVTLMDTKPRAELQAQINRALEAAGLNPCDVAKGGFFPMALRP